MRLKEKNKTEMAIPAKLSIRNMHCSQVICDEFISIVFVLEGSIKVSIKNNEIIIKEEEILIINKFDPTMIQSDNEGLILMFQLDSLYFNKFYNGFSDMKFVSYLGGKADDYLKHLIAKTFESLETNNETYRIEVEKYLLEISILLMEKYNDSGWDYNRIKEDYLSKIILYIKENYKKKLGLQEIAEYVHLNQQYISRFFSKTTGTTITDYINIVRLNSSLDSLRYGNENISDIALGNGFPNIKSYFKAFKKYFNETPAQYRRAHKGELLSFQTIYNIENREYVLNKLYTFLNDEFHCKNVNVESGEELIIDINKTVEELDFSWRNILAFSRASEGMGEELRNQLRQVQKDIKFKYVRFHGIFSDEMKIYNEDEKGNVYYDFSYANQLIDFLLEIGLKPFIEFSFMPEQLASKKEYIFAWRANISLPKDMGKWCDLITSFLRHFIDRFGIKEVSSWYFEIWNDPDFFHKLSSIPISEKMSFFTATYKAVKSVDERLRIGGINTYGSYLAADDCKLLKTYFKHFRKNKIYLDFISFSVFPLEFKGLKSVERFTISNRDNTDFISPQNLIPSTTYAKREYTSSLLDKLNAWIRNNMSYKGEIILNEWNLTPDPRDKINDTSFKSTFFIDNVLNNYHKVDSFTYWTFTDIFNELKYKTTPFHGGIGFLTNNGLKKPIYYAYQFLNRLGKIVVYRGEDLIVTQKEGGSLQVIIYNYCNFRRGYREINYQEKHNRYSVFNERQKEVNITLSGLSGHFTVNTYKLNKENGSVFDEWKNIGAPMKIGNDILDYLKYKSIYKFNTDTMLLTGEFRIREILEPHEIVLIELKK